MIFNPTELHDITEQIPAPVLDEVAYLLNLEVQWLNWVTALGMHPVYAKRVAGVRYNGYESLAAYLTAKAEQDALINDALAVLRDIRVRLYGNPWGN